MRSATVYVPAGTGELLGIDPRSGIVGQPVANGFVEVYFEGNRFGASNIVTFADRCHHAADRMWESYPTIARKTVPASLLEEAGTFTEGHGVDPADVKHTLRLVRWIGCTQDELGVELRLDGGRR